MRRIINEEIEIEEKEEIKRNGILFPICKLFLEEYQQHRDIITTYERAVKDIPIVMEKISISKATTKGQDDKYLDTMIYIKNIKIARPTTINSINKSFEPHNVSPNEVLSSLTGGTYYVLIEGDTYMKMDLYEIENGEKRQIPIENGNEILIEKSVSIGIPIPIGCEWCTLNDYDRLTQLKTGEDMESLKGYFIIDSHIKHIVPIYKKPFNKPLTVRNEGFKEQISRTEVLYTKGHDYENSYYIVGAMIKKKPSKSSIKKSITIYPNDFVLSLQLNHPKMNGIGKNINKNMQELYNLVPIKVLFCAFGCTNDEDMIKYINPDLDDLGLIHAVRESCLYGHIHNTVYKNAGIELISDDGLNVPKEKLNELTSLYIIGDIILNKKTKESINSDNILEKGEYISLIASITKNILDGRFMPGIGSNNSNIDRNSAICTELGRIIRDLYRIGNGLEYSHSRTTLENRRIRVGQQLVREFKSFWEAFLRELKRSYQNTIKTNGLNSNNIKSIMENLLDKEMKIISLKMTSSILNSFKGANKEKSKLKTDIIKTKNQAFIYNKLREIVISSESKIREVQLSWDHRTVHSSELFFICPTQTPEAGNQTGRYKTPTVYTFVTIGTLGENEMNIIKQDENVVYKLINEEIKVKEMYIIRLNGSIIGYIKEYHPVESLYNKLINERIKGNISIETSIILDNIMGTLDIWTDSGRLMSLFVRIENSFDITKLKNNKDIYQYEGVTNQFKEWLNECEFNKSNLNKGLLNGFIEFLCPEMAIHNAVIAPTLEDFYKNPAIYTHIALPNAMHGIIAGIVSGLPYNTGVRASYSTNHVKQAIGGSIKYPQLKFMTEDVNILCFPEVPLIRPMFYNFIGLNKNPLGQNVCVAFIPFKDNQEDAVIINKASVDNGLLQINSIITYRTGPLSTGEKFAIPKKVTLSGNPTSYIKLDSNTCLPSKIGSEFYEKDPIIARIITKKGVNTKESIIDNSLINNKPDGKYPRSARLRPLIYSTKHRMHETSTTSKIAVFSQYRALIPGDKINSEFAQKGTIGLILPESEIPYTSYGIKPDIIFNPLSIFKRKTFGHSYASVAMTIACLLGCSVDMTSFWTTRKIEELEEILVKLGLNNRCTEIMYDADSGKPYEAEIYFGVHYWERQYHLVEQKLNIRNGGPRVPDTRQPVKGRRINGGASLDRMGNDCLNAAGIGQINRDAHLEQGSKIELALCKRCHMFFTYYDKNMKRWTCHRCGQHKDISIKIIPPASGLLIHILNGLHVHLKYYEDSENTIYCPEKDVKFDLEY